MKISKLMTMALIMFGALFTSCSKDDTVKVSSVKLSQTTVSIQLGEKVSLKATVTPSDATDAIVTWSTSSASVATVDNSGNVSAVSIGTATITASAGGMTATCTVTVKPKAVTGVTLSESTLTLKTGDKAELKATVVPSDATDGTVTWTSSAATVAKVDEKGNVTAVAAGTATITAKAGDMTATCTVTVKERDVYIAGTAYDASGNDSAVLLKNGVATSLTDGKYTAAAHSVYVSGGSVYVAGNQVKAIGEKASATLWKDGTATYLTDGKKYAAAYSVYVSGSDIYVGGRTYDYSCVLWKNGVATNLPGVANKFGYVESISASGSDVYVVASEESGSSYSKAFLWKNGVLAQLETGSYTKQMAHSVYASGSDVYVAGEVSDGGSYKAALWKNGVLTVLSTNMSRANEVFVYGSDVYVVGRDYNGTETIIALWKNGVKTNLFTTKANCEGTSIYVSNGDVYVIGYEYDGSFHGLLIKNGVKTDLQAKFIPNSIFVY